MRRAVPILCLAGALGVWAWALVAPKEQELKPLPDRFVGTFRFLDYAAPPGRAMDNPLPAGMQHLLTLRADGTYLFRVLVSEEYEIFRHEGLVTVSEDGVLTLTTISTNRLEDRGARLFEAPLLGRPPAATQPKAAPPDRFHVEWGEDEKGTYLVLRHVEVAYTLRLRK